MWKEFGTTTDIPYTSTVTIIQRRKTNPQENKGEDHFIHFSLKLLSTTLTLEKAISAEAHMGVIW